MHRYAAVVSFGFAQPAYSAEESLLSVEVCVTRSGDIQESILVTLSTTDGTTEGMYVRTPSL